MKRNLIPLFFCFIFTLAFGQSNDQLPHQRGGCGAVAPPSFYKAYAARDRSNYPALLSQRAGITWIPIVYHLAAMDDGTGSASLQSVFYSNCYLNTSFNQFGVGFFILAIDTIASTSLWEYASDPSVVFDQYNNPSACNVYIPGNMGDLCGVGTFPQTYPNGGGVFVSALCFGEGTTTLNHEMGHFFGLLHTFDTTYGVEFVNGTNCKTAGDLFCDTPADFLDVVSPCPYTGDQTDPNGDLYRTVIDPTLFMSYFEDYCVKRYSNMEAAEMVNALNTQRPELLNQQAPNTNLLDTVTFIAPVNGDMYVNSANPTFRWDTVPGAVYYYFHLQSANTVVVYADTVVTQNYFTANKLVPNKPYKYSVQAVSRGNTCYNNVEYQNIQTATIEANFIVNSPVCSGLTTGSITVIPQGGVPPYYYYWNTGSVDSVLTSLAEGDYRLTVSDDNGSQVSSYIHVNAPAPLLINVNTQPGNLVALATGGTLPYFYRWSNGVNEAANYGVAKGDYQVSVTDGNGCTASQGIDYTAVGVIPDMKADMKVFPNPAYGSQVHIQLQLNRATPGSVSLVNLNGEIVYQFSQNFMAGTNNLHIGAEQLPSGIYLLRFVSNDAVITEQVSVIR